MSEETKKRLDYCRDVVLADIASVIAFRWKNKALEDSSGRFYDAISAHEASDADDQMHSDVAGILSAYWVHGVELNSQDPAGQRYCIRKAKRTDYRAGQPVVSQRENPSRLIDAAGFRLRGGAVNCHDQRHYPIDSFDTLLFGGLPVVGRIGLDRYIRRHPPQHRIPGVVQLALQDKLL